MRRRSVGAFSGEKPETVERVVNRVFKRRSVRTPRRVERLATFEAAYFEELQ
jgi:hypothetical protein